MPVIQKFVYEWPEGKTHIDLQEWVKTLPQNEQDEFFEAEKRQHKYRNDVLADGSMLSIDSEGYIWKDADARKKEKPKDEIWVIYFERYISENNIVFKDITIEIPD